MMVVAGIICFGIGLNYWLDMNRVANQGARWAAVDNWPATSRATPIRPPPRVTRVRSPIPHAMPPLAL